ncbi:MAG: hypothetical protein JSR48_04815 [Verrucomicrobia bacterium]|nr:hypothetical protein [Verrucomicrobiota bacterium]
MVVSIIRGVVKTLGRITPPAAPGRRPIDFDPAEAERTRRIQEEIRRRIAERRGRSAGSQAPAEPPLMPAPAAVPEAVKTADRSAEHERQNQLVADLRAATMDKLFRQRKAEANAAAAAEVEAAHAAIHATRNAVLDGLQNPSSIRQAILLREILDRPVGLR